MLLYKELKKEFVKLLKGTELRSVVFGELTTVRNYPAARITLTSVSKSDDQVIQSGNQMMWDYAYTVEVMFKGSESEHTSDNLYILVNKIYDVIYQQKTDNSILNGIACNLDVEGIEYSTVPEMDKGFVYTGTINVVYTVVENR